MPCIPPFLALYLNGAFHHSMHGRAPRFSGRMGAVFTASCNLTNFVEHRAVFTMTCLQEAGDMFGVPVGCRDSGSLRTAKAAARTFVVACLA